VRLKPLGHLSVGTANLSSFLLVIKEFIVFILCLIEYVIFNSVLDYLFLEISLGVRYLIF